MILPDINLLLHAYNGDSPHHAGARRWWLELMQGEGSVGLPWAVLLGFLRLSTHPQVMPRPMAVGVATAHVRAWLAQAHVLVLEPGPRHAGILLDLLDAIGTAGNLTTDAHLAALALEHQAELHSTDADFARFPGLRWRNPLAPATRRR
ncbi:MAG: type II toxin-antitoxin system VapC family toxin [Terriglobales bacterium]